MRQYHSMMRNHIFQDWNINHHNAKGRFVMVFFRCASIVNKNLILKIIFFWYLIIYKIVIGWFLNIEISPKARIGRDFKLEYGFGSVINDAANIGNSCTFRHLSTISSKILENGTFGPSPIIGNNVDIGANASIIGGIHIGDDVVIGAGAVVTKDVDSHCVIGGNPAVILKMIYKFPLGDPSIKIPTT